jgi:shikimate dehydrogenase
LLSASHRAVRLGVLGWPVLHSRSPAIQNAALAAAGLADWRYQLLPCPPELLGELIAALPGAGFGGVNVTIPHKEAALALSSDPSARARAIGAANTLVFKGDEAILADNTDAPALIAALPKPVSGSTALVLGAGGSARAAVWALGDAGAAEVRIWNRTPERARRLARDLGANAVTEAQPADVLVNCTSVGLDGAGSLAGLPVSVERLSEFGCAVDLVYTAAGTPLTRAARERGIPTVDGLEILVGQGALSFEQFTGVTASVVAMRAAVER